MTNEEIITQLEDIKCHCQEMYEAEIKNGDTSSSIWGKDVEALDFAIKALEQQPCEDTLDRIITQIEQVRDKDKLCEYSYNRCIKIIEEHKEK